MKRTFLLITSLLCSVCLSACSTSGAGGAGAESREPSRREFFAMDTYMRFSAYGEGAEQALQEAEEEIYRLESEWSVTDEGSEIYQVNHSGGTPVDLSDETAQIVRFALDMAEETSGDLDPTIYPVVEAWGFTTDENRIPGQEELQTLLELSEPEYCVSV